MANISCYNITRIKAQAFMPLLYSLYTRQEEVSIHLLLHKYKAIREQQIFKIQDILIY